MIAPDQCPLCQGVTLTPWHQDGVRPYWLCTACALVFVPRPYHLDTAAEKAIYDLHQNDTGDAGYRRFLSRLLTPLLARLPGHASGLDFGCGPGPVLATMLEDAGHTVQLYDKLYQPDATVLDRCYDFVTASEVVEHLDQPRVTWNTLQNLLKPGGWLAIMTKRVRDQAAFSRWHYIRDPTHIAFYHDATFAWIARHWQLSLDICGADVVLLQKPGQ